MSATNRTCRILSLLLAFVMIFTLLPVSHASAAEAVSPENVIFFATDRHEETSKLNSLLKALAYTPGLVVLGGDHVNNTNSGSLASITSEIQSVYPGVQTFYTYAAHDKNVTADSSNPYAYARTGEVYEGADYYVYGVDQDHMQSSSNAATATANFKTWAASADASKVIFVMCHMPIHKRRGDNAGGATWLNALNEVGQTHDVVFLWGHNHTGENSSDTSVYFVARGGSITPQGGSSTTINFTYMNAGYIKNGYASMVVVGNDAVQVSRYNTSGSVTASYTIERQFGGHSHNWYVSQTVDSTCTENGTVFYACDGCEETYSEVIPATGHNYRATVTAPTCTEGGYTTYTCDCGDSYVSDETGALGHSYESVTVEATCTQDGSVTYKCACGEIYTEVLPATGHNYQATITAPTCTEGGYTTYTCDCGDSYVSDETDALGHDYEIVTVAPTCTEDGYTTYTCRNCGDGYVYDEVAALGHNYTSVTVEATCETAGGTTHTCETCGHSYVTDEVAALGHDYETVTVAATCTADGSVTTKCLTCGDTAVEIIPALGHNYKTVTVEATCETAGSVSSVCSECGHSSTEVIPALGHNYETLTVAATCTEDGSVTTTCSNCGESTVEVIEAPGHAYTSTTVEATCTTSGQTTHKCANCGDSYVTDEVAALGHSYTSVVTAPTCTAQGYTTHKCGSCGHSYTSDTVAATGHSYTTTESNGYLIYTCQGCGHSYSEKLDVDYTYTKVSSISSGNNYVITLRSSSYSSTYYALSHKNNTISLVKVTVSNGVITSDITEDLVWSFANGKLSYEDDGTTYYLYVKTSGSGWRKTYTLTVSTTNSSSVSFSSSRLKVDSRYLRYSGGKVSLSTASSTTYCFIEK